MKSDQQVPNSESAEVKSGWAAVSNPGGFVHGALVAGATLAVASTADDTVRQIVVATLVILAVYWATHSYTRALGDRIADPGTRSSTVLREATTHEMAVFLGGLPGLGAFIVATVVGLEVSAAGDVALWLTIVLLGSAGYAIGRRGGAHGWMLTVEVGTAVLLGVLMLVLKELLQHLH
jgi:hypothetical protein